ncbi:MAG TPA: D-2-hydroxyacid dehydrogenase [Candidatus Binatia bacterium]|nr:D-2-hydroxyacid dehydrogenase [Candidatus Binatia bacterium]
MNRVGQGSRPAMARGTGTSPPRTILVYQPTRAEALAYARLIRLPRASLSVRVAGSPAEAEAAIGEAEILYAWDFPRSLLRRAGRLRWVQSTGAGVEKLLGPELSPDVVVTRAAGIFGPWMAEYALGWCLWVTQRVEVFRSQQARRQWRPVDPCRLRGATLAVVGLGDIGRTIARTARAFGMTVLGVSRSGRRVPGVDRVYRATAIRTALSRADFAVLTVPLTAHTRGFVGARELAAMKRSAWLVNVGRGAVVDEVALVRALSSRRIAGAVLDVFEREPLPPDHPLWRLRNAVVTPHISGPSTPAEVSVIFNENLRRWVAGRPLRHVVDRRRGY